MTKRRERSAVVEFTPAPRPKRPDLEADVKDYFTKRVHALGGEIRKVQWEGRRKAPDNFVMLPGSQPNFWVEFKRPGWKMNAHIEAQFREHDLMRKYDEIVHVISTRAMADAALLPWGRNRK